MKNYIIFGLVFVLATMTLLLAITPTRNAIFGIDTNATTTITQDGKSAYDLAVENGFEGSVEEWLESLKGSNGTNGINGIDGDNTFKVLYDGSNDSNYYADLTETYDLFWVILPDRQLQRYIFLDEWGSGGTGFGDTNTIGYEWVVTVAIYNYPAPYGRLWIENIGNTQANTVLPRIVVVGIKFGGVQ